MSQEPTPAQLAAAVRRAVEEANADLQRMPFFVRAFVKGGLAKRTGLDADEWLRKLDTLRAGDTPTQVTARWPDVREALARLAENFRTAPERAARGMKDPEALRRVTELSKQRSEAVEALLAWLGR